MTQPPQLDPELVRDFVGKAHGDLDGVRGLLEQHRELANAAWDWGGGDWETGLGAAAHTGRTEIARYLLDCGARMDVFAAAMLGHIEIVRAILEACPDVWRSRGSHGIPLLKHAEAGGSDAAAVVDFLTSLNHP